MRDFLFEIKKVFIYQKGAWFILLLVLLKILSLIILDNGSDIRLEADKEDYLFYLEQVKGALTEETQSFLRDESGKIASAKVKLENLYSDYYDGVIYNQVMPEEELDSLSKPFEEQIEKEKGFQLIYDQYMYIRENPDNRYFLYTNGWNALLAHERLDLPMFFLLLLLIAPMFCNEYESKMDIILLSSKKGRVTLVLKKILLAFGMVTLLSLLFSLVEYTYFNFRYGLSDGDYPIQSLEYFHSSLKNMSLLGAFIRVSGYKLFGYLCFSVLIMFVSICTKKTILTLFISTSAILLPYFGLTAQWIQYLLPLPLGFMLGSGFFRGDKITDSVDAIEPKVEFRAINDTEFKIIAILLIFIVLTMILVMIKKYINFQPIRREVQFTKREAGEKQ
ncbi:hypothetical protein KQI41_10785 [Tissierella pigra]|uniref:Uncharacterized protein n=1 Tax=Tissierella pigra TaxID=2607614 RepID=A0A6N7Y5H0_9FIRM|nr:hypothetical protein [Tissierella pigra]MBU5426896.1 hypothetical protein [Tissierella pigra]MSU03290.1 hypothetical protein [Tissierella pigra]